MVGCHLICSLLCSICTLQHSSTPAATLQGKFGQICHLLYRQVARTCAHQSGHKGYATPTVSPGSLQYIMQADCLHSFIYFFPTNLLLPLLLLSAGVC